MKDLLGVACAGLCIAHCMALPLLMAAGVSVVGLTYLANESTHLWLATAMVLLALWAFPPGLRAHKRLLPVGMAISGIGAMFMALLADESLEAYLAATSGLALIAGHALNHYWLLKHKVRDEV